MNNDPQNTADSAAAGDGGSGARPASRRHIILIVVKIAVSVALLWLLFSTYDISDALARLYTVKPEFLVLAAVIELAGIAISTLRWEIILRAMGLRLGYFSAFPIVYIGLFFNQVLPSNLGGDAMRVWRIFSRGSDLVYAIGSVMMDRVMALIGLAVLVSVCLPFVPSLTDDPLLFRTLIGIVFVILSGLAVLLVFDRFLPLVRRILPEELMQQLVALSHDIRRFLLGLRASIPALAISIINHVAMVAMAWVIALGLHIEVGFVECLVLIPPVILFSLLPVSFAGWGMREGAMVAALGVVGVAPGDSIAISVTFGLVLLVTSLPGGIIWFVSGNRRR